MQFTIEAPREFFTEVLRDAKVDLNENMYSNIKHPITPGQIDRVVSAIVDAISKKVVSE